MSWFDLLRQTLDKASQPVVFFFRDDDAGWEDRRLFELIDLFCESGVPLDLAVIPKAISRDTAKRLRAVIEISRQQLSLHQHGYAHENHERNGRKSEFGESRSAGFQLADIESGQRVLFAFFGATTDPIFTPPWNRCSPATANCLRQAGFRYLSRDITARRLDAGGIYELPIAVDWFKRQKGVRLSLREIGNSLNGAAVGQIPVGVMLHHALMDQEERKRLGELLQYLSSHSQAHCALMRDVSTSEAGETS